MVVLDTSALLFWTLHRKKLSSAAIEAITGADGLIISSITIWEIGIKVHREQIALPISLKDYVEKLAHIDRLEIVPVDENMWLENVALDWEHRDPADRTIVAVARLLACPLVTSDRVIRAFYKDSIW
jgi:PIN domain nuclease of toxin-antitoxin system